MKRKIIGQKRRLVILVVIGLWISVAAAEDSTTLIKEKLKQGCEMTVSFKQEKDNCEMVVKIKEDFEETVSRSINFEDRLGLASVEIEKAINVELEVSLRMVMSFNTKYCLSKIKAKCVLGKQLSTQIK